MWVIHTLSKRVSISTKLGLNRVEVMSMINRGCKKSGWWGHGLKGEKLWIELGRLKLRN